MKQLIGRWEGTGVASYPTIATTHYRETLTFQQQDDEPRLFYEQKTWHIVDGVERVLHWESGFIRQIEADRYEWINAQNNGRVEVMTGKLKQTKTGVTLMFESAAFANDPRMKAAMRSLTLSDDSLSYKQSMATQTHDTIKPHLEATLTRA